MSLAHGKIEDIVDQPETFSFTPENVQQAERIIARYPEGRQQSAVMPLLALAQRQNDNWLPKAAMDYVAHMLGMAPIRVYEVATFYTMYNLQPMGRYHVQVCTTTPCWLRGSGGIVEVCEQHLGVKVGETTPDQLFTLSEAECLGACVNAPMMQVGDLFYEDLTPESTVALLEQFRSGSAAQPGPQNGRRSSEPIGMPPPVDRTPPSRKPVRATAPKTPIHGDTAAETAEENLPGQHPRGDKRYSKESSGETFELVAPAVPEKKARAPRKPAPPRTRKKKDE